MNATSPLAFALLFLVGLAFFGVLALLERGDRLSAEERKTIRRRDQRARRKAMAS